MCVRQKFISVSHILVIVWDMLASVFLLNDIRVILYSQSVCGQSNRTIFTTLMAIVTHPALFSFVGGGGAGL